MATWQVNLDLEDPEQPEEHLYRIEGAHAVDVWCSSGSWFWALTVAEVLAIPPVPAKTKRQAQVYASAALEGALLQ